MWLKTKRKSLLSAELNCLADDEADIAAYGNGQAWTAQNENEADIAAYGLNFYLADDEADIAAYDDAQAWNWNEYDVKYDDKCWDEDEYEGYNPDWWYEDAANWQLNEDEERGVRGNVMMRSLHFIEDPGLWLSVRAGELALRQRNGRYVDLDRRIKTIVAQNMM